MFFEPFLSLNVLNVTVFFLKTFFKIECIPRFEWGNTILVRQILLYSSIDLIIILKSFDYVLSFFMVYQDHRKCNRQIELIKMHYQNQAIWAGWSVHFVLTRRKCYAAISDGFEKRTNPTFLEPNPDLLLPVSSKCNPNIVFRSYQDKQIYKNLTPSKLFHKEFVRMILTCLSFHLFLRIS